MKQGSRLSRERVKLLRDFVENYISIMRCYVSLFESRKKGKILTSSENLPNHENLDFYDEEFDRAIILVREYFSEREREKLKWSYYGLEARVRLFVTENESYIRAAGLMPEVHARRLR